MLHVVVAEDPGQCTATSEFCSSLYSINFTMYIDNIQSKPQNDVLILVFSFS